MSTINAFPVRRYAKKLIRNTQRLTGGTWFEYGGVGMTIAFVATIIAVGHLRKEVLTATTTNADKPKLDGETDETTVCATLYHAAKCIITPSNPWFCQLPLPLPSQFQQLGFKEPPASKAVRQWLPYLRQSHRWQSET